jgi:hypothetical protein
LNVDILTGRLYPDLATIASMTDNEIAIAMSIYGPDGKSAHKVSWKIVKNATYKNWRLNGEFIRGRIDDPTRYDGIQAGDLAVMAFKGDSSPSGMDLILISQSRNADAVVHAALLPWFGNKSTIAASPARIAMTSTALMVPQAHPIRIAIADLELDAALEDAAHNGVEGMRRLQANNGIRKASHAELAKAKANSA